MTDKDKQDGTTPSNIELAREAIQTNDEERQVLLAQHPSRVVKRALATNKALCQRAMEILGDELEDLRHEVHDQAADAGEVSEA